jgi:hypothetical protein
LNLVLVGKAVNTFVECATAQQRFLFLLKWSLL